VRIFDRSASGSELTPIGELIVERAARVIAETEDIIRDAALLAGGEAGRVRIGVGSSLTGEFLPRFLDRVVETYPNLSVHIESGAWAGLLADLASRDVDIAICALAPEAKDTRFVITGVLDSIGVAVASPTHPLAGLDRIALGEFAMHKTAGPPGDFRADVVLGMPEHEALSFYTSNSYDALLPLALAGKATLVAPQFMVQHLVRAGQLVQLNVDLDFAVSFVAVTVRAASYSPILNRLTRIAQDVGAELSAEWGASASETPTAPG
jgi:DNA-binding transcriptional LysR family regulator